MWTQNNNKNIMVDIEDLIFAILRERFSGVEIDKLRAQSESRELLKRFLNKYIEVLNS